ncbi:MAG: chemotaxis protein CheB [Casimicrobiaceae bacterium]
MSPAPASISPETLRLIVIGASAGGLAAVRTVVEALPADLPAAVLVVIHTAANSPRLLADLLHASGALPAAYARDAETLRAGRIYVAPPDHHLMVHRTTLEVVRSPKENRARPAIDPLFRSAAWAAGPAVVGVVLSGMLNDGTAGLWAVKTCGGVSVVQDPDDARYGEMPLHAIRHVPVDYRLPASGIGPLLTRLARNSSGAAQATMSSDHPLGLEVEMARMRENDMTNVDRIGRSSPFTCLACQGTLWEVDDEHVLCFRCHTGHAFTSESLEGSQDQHMEDAS